MSFVIRSLPTKSSQLKNKNAAALISFFAFNASVLYLYGDTGTGKTFAVDMLAKEYGYETLYVEPPFENVEVQAAASYNLFTNDKKLIIIDSGDLLKSVDVKALAKGYWGETRLVIIGDAYPRSSPLRSAFKGQPYKYVAIKGARVSYEVLLRIAQESTGDMRAARLSLRALIASGSGGEVERFLPLSENAYYNNINRLFSPDSNDVSDAIDFFGSYISIQIMRKNLIARMSDRSDLMYLLKMCLELGDTYPEYLIQLGSSIGKEMKSKKFLSYKKPIKFEVPQIEANCSSVKKILYFRGYEKWMKQEQ